MRIAGDVYGPVSLLYATLYSNSTLALWGENTCRSSKGGPVLYRNSVKSGGEVDITKLLNVPCPCNQALIWLPFSCYLVAGKMAKVELNERLGFSALIAQHLTDPRRGKNTQLPLAELLRQSVYSRLAGYEDVNDAERVSQGPTFRLIGSEKIWERGAALTSRLQSFETELMAQDENFTGLAQINRELIAKAEAVDSPQRVVRDMDSTEIPVYGQQEHSADNGHFESTCDHPLLLFNREGDCLAAKLRPGNVHSAEDWDELLFPEIERQQQRGKEVTFRADAAFAKPEIYEALEERGVTYAIRLPANSSLERDIAGLLTRLVGRPSQKPVVWYKSFLYQAASWNKARSVVAKVEHHQGELFPKVGFIVTNLRLASRAVVRFYNKRGTAEHWIKEGKQAVKMPRLSCHRFRSNEV